MKRWAAPTARMASQKTAGPVGGRRHNGDVATYQDEAGELYDDAEIEDFFYSDTAGLDVERRAEVTFEAWLEEMLDWGRFTIVEDGDE